MLLIWVILAILFWVLYKFWISSYKIWEHRGVPFLAASFPFGTDWNLTLLRKFQGETLDKMYKRAHPSPYFGIYVMRAPVLVVRDPEIVKLVLAKEFSHFRDRQGFDLSEDDHLSHNLFNIEGERWRGLRVKMSPTFSTGKLKAMFPLFVECSEALGKRLLSEKEKSIDVKNITGTFTADVICSCAFGIDVNSKGNLYNNFVRIATNQLALSLGMLSKMLLLRTLPSTRKYIQLRFVPKEHEEFLIGVIRDTIEHRIKNGVNRNDFLDLMIELREKGKIVVNDEDISEVETDHQAQPIEMTTELIAAQCYVFFVAGYETSSSVQSFCLYELAIHPEIQERLCEEIESTISKHGKLTYQAVQDMKYLDMVVHETMRKYPTLPVLLRRCTKQFSMPAGNKVLVGDRLIIPTWSLHHDPEYFPNPDKFDPERFSPENKENIKPYTYLPFGEGPRLCIGMRFGLLQTKVGIITILRKYKVGPCAKTTIPIEFVGSTVVTTTKGPIYLKFDKRMA